MKIMARDRLYTAARGAAGTARQRLARTCKGAWENWTGLLGNARGNATVLFGFSAIALVGGVGIAIDTSVAYNVRSQLAAAADAASLAGARAFASPNRDTDIQNFFNANFDDGYMGSVLEPLDIDVNPTDRTVTVTATVNIPTKFMSLFGTDSIEISATSEATLSSRDVEVALVLDVTASMNTNDRIGDLKDAAQELVDVVVQDQQIPFYSKVALVPYSMGVNVGDLADEVRGTYIAGATCEYPDDEPDCETYRFENMNHDIREQDISTCVTERTGAHAYTDQAPNLAPVGRNFPGQTANACLDAEIMPLTSNKTALTTAIENLETIGSTAGQIGIAWGWYMISPNFAYLWPEANRPMNYGEVNLGRTVLKVVIVMTDGEFNTIYYDGVVAKNSDSGSGDPADKINKNGVNGNGFAQALALCDNMKAEGVEVYTVGFAGASTGDAAEFVEDCATDAEHVYLPSSGTDLKQAFRDIAAQIARLRISM